MIDTSIRKLVCYGLQNGLIDSRDEIYITNKILEILNIDSFDCEENFDNVSLEDTLKELLDFAVNTGLIEDTITHRDLFDTKIMSALVPPPSVITEKFNAIYEKSLYSSMTL